MEPDFSGNTITLVGAGNVGTHLGTRLKEAGYRIMQVAGRSSEHTAELAGRLQCAWTTDLNALKTDVSIVILCVNDRSLEEVIGKIHPEDALVVHTAGAVSADVFKGKVKNYGVLYPLQSFSRGRMPQFKGLPFCIEANNADNEKQLEKLVLSLTSYPVRISSDKRLMLHLSAVFVNNFTNFMYISAKKILDHTDLPFSLLSPIMHETVAKAVEIGPENAQTGPAVRNEQNVIKKHIELLSFSPEIREIYKDITHKISGYPGWQ